MLSFYRTAFVFVTFTAASIAVLSPQAFLVAQVSESDAKSAREFNVATAIARHIQLGSAAYQQKNYVKSAEQYSKAIELGHDEPSIAYNAACSASLANELDLAFDFLDKAISLGWIDSKLLQKDTDLAPLYQNVRWERVVAKTIAAENAVKSRWNSSAFKTPYAENISDSQKAAGLAKLWSEVKYNFAHFDQVSDLDWDATYMESLPKALATDSTYEYFLVLQRMVAKLNDGHTNVYLPSELAVMDASPGISTRLIEDKVIVVQVYDRSAKEAGLEVGMEIIKINSMAVKDYAAENVAPYLCASTQQDRQNRLYGSRLMKGPLKEPVSIAVKAENGNESEIKLSRKPKMQSVIRRFSQAAFKFEVLDGNVGYLQLNSFVSERVATQFAANFSKIAQTDALIIDLRKNGGGNSRHGWEILTYFTKQPFQTTRWHTLQYRPTMRAWGRQPITPYAGQPSLLNQTEKATYDKPVVMLIGPETFSAAEDMAAVFDQLDRGKLIGQATGGSTGQPLSFDLPGGGKARVCTKHDFYANGTEFVGIGIQPDVEVPETVTDIRKGVDTVLVAALRELRTRNE